MDRLEYNNLMKALTKRLNLSLKNKTSEGLDKSLYYLLVVMYINEYGERPNIGALFQLIGGNSFSRLNSRFSLNPNLILEFNEERNELIFGDVFMAKINWCDVFDEQCGVGSQRGLQIVVKNSDINDYPHFGNDVDVFLLRENTLWIEHKDPKPEGINHKPYQVKSYEQRTFDLYGIEMERVISTEFRLGISASREAIIGGNYIAPVGLISNITKVCRDLDYFKMAKIEVLQKNSGVSKNSQVKYAQGILNTPKSSFYVKQELYGLCPVGFSLDVNQTVDTFEEGLDICKRISYLNVENISNDAVYRDVYPKPLFLQLQEEVDKRNEAAREACKKYFEDGNKKK